MEKEERNLKKCECANLPSSKEILKCNFCISKNLKEIIQSQILEVENSLEVGHAKDLDVGKENVDHSNIDFVSFNDNQNNFDVK